MSGIVALKPEFPAVPSMSDEEPLFEILDGTRVEIPHMSTFATLIASRLLGELHLFLKSAGLGQAVMETLFRLALASDRNRRPDVAFVSFQRWPRNRAQRKEENAWDVVPDLAVEVVSPHDYAEELLDKIDEYFRAGVRLVWVVYPKHSLIYVYESLTKVRGLSRTDVLEGGDVLPGFRLPLQELFLEETSEPADTVP